MKTIILSDINNSAKSIIPYGLRVARELESEVDVLHVIDPRSHPGAYSSLSDSQSISPGETLSHAETIKHAKNRASIKLDKLLSAEGSRLNYPLKINRVIVENSVEDELEQRLAQNPDCLLIVNAEMDQDMLDTTEEAVRLIKKTGVPSFIVPPGETFKSDISALMPLNLDQNNFTSLTDLKFFFDKFKLNIDAVGVVLNGDYTTMELKSLAWKDTVSDFFLSETKLNTNVLEGKDFIDTISNYFKRNNRHLLLLINDSENINFSVAHTVELLDSVKSPALVYFPK
ncbi:hypothetical protein [Draconibacterium halophilum]|uniref:Universal stress protein family protein n=1 Tax=Draconibacterium halophilum TaxID=2706887 RepID=A0A6C0RHT5_9BACT|nr:hypothetical protein [Draconibacterium halophilum]QIA09103.1 hypothetical protein G0Q07_15880 [Draconibacterium halophilum]